MEVAHLLGSRIESPKFPEPVEITRLEPMGGGYWQLDARGCHTRRAYQLILNDSELQQIRVPAGAALDFQGDPEAFFLALEAYRLHYAYLFDPLLAVNVSQIDPLPHQIEAVYHYILRQPDIRFLLADDPGAGKTIMAGLLVKELKYRGVAHRILLVVPGHLKFQWQREMKEKFGEQFVVVDRSVLEAHWGRNVWLEQSQIITSLDFAKQEHVMATLREAFWDLVIVDEAHKMAAYQYGTKTSKTARYRLGELLSVRTHGLLFLTATPHRGDPENFRLFLDLLRPGFFSTVDLLEQSVRQRDNPLFLRRLKEDLKDFEGRPLFPPRHVYTRTFQLSDAEKQLYNALTEYVEKEYNRALQGENRNAAFALILLQRRFASSIYAARKSLERRKQRLEKLLQLGTRFTEEGQGKLFDWDELEEMEEANRLQLEEEMLEKLTNARTLEELRTEVATLDELVRLAREADKQDIETKFRELTEVLSELQLRGSEEKLLVFTESRDTLDYLVRKLRGMGFSVTELHGGMSMDDRIRAEHEFRHHTQIMVSTEAGGEGINLQFCSLMVNYDIPWNPNRLEQRMGRIHRYGQTREVHIYNLVAYDTREGEVLATLLDKLQKIQEQLGTDRVFDVIGDLLERNLRDLIIEAITNRRSWQEIVDHLKAMPDTELIARIRQATQEALATRHIDMQAILGETRRARENRLVPEYVEQFFHRACQYLKIEHRAVEPHVWRVRSLPSEIRRVSEQFKRQFGEVHSEYTRIAFDKSVARNHNAEFVAMGHPLLESIAQHLRNIHTPTLKRGTLLGDPEGKLNGWLYFYLTEMRDGNDQPAAQQITVLYVDASGTIQQVNSSILWDLTPVESRFSPPPSNAPTEENKIRLYLVEQVLIPQQREWIQKREELAQIKEKYGIASLNRRIGALMDEELRQDLPEVERSNIRRRKEEAEQQLKQLREQIEREKQISLCPPQLLTVARVIPHPNAGTHGMVSDPEIERIGMEMTMAYERDQKRIPEDVSAQCLGYDIRSVATDGSVRYIEVKARACTGDVVLTPNEWLMAQRLGEEYWLYIVTNAASKPELHLIQNPAAKVKPKMIQEVVRYQVPSAEWQSHAMPACEGTIRNPDSGRN